MATFPKLPQPVIPAEIFVAPATLDAARGRAAVEHAVKDGFLKPADIGSVELGEPALLYAPFWQLDIAIDGTHPMGTMMVSARTAVPYQPRLPSRFGHVPGLTSIEVEPRDLVARKAVAAEEALEGAEIVDADIDRDRAEAAASSMLLRAVRPTNALYTTFDPKVLGATFCLYPLYYARYSYEGEARRHPGEELFVAVSARTGEVIAAAHPSPVRAMTNKLRKLLSFDFR